MMPTATVISRNISKKWAYAYISPSAWAWPYCISPHATKQRSARPQEERGGEQDASRRANPASGRTRWP